MLNWQRAAKMLRDKRVERARIGIARRYERRVLQVEFKAKMFSSAFMSSNRDLFNRLVEFYAPAVEDRGRYLLNLRATCEAVVSMLMIQHLMQEHLEELEAIDPVRAELMSLLVVDYAAEVDEYFATLKRADFPLKPLISEYRKRLSA